MRTSLLSRQLTSRPVTYQDFASPGDFASCELWLSADGVTGVSDGSTVGTWPDKSGNSADATQTTETSKPTFEVGELNGFPVLRFDATSGMETATSSIPRACTIMYIAKFNGAGSAARRMVQGNSTNWLMGPYNNVWNYYNGFGWSGGLAGQETPIGGGFVFHCVAQDASAGWTELLIDFDVRPGVASQSWEAYKITAAGNTAAPGVLAIGNAGAFGESPESDIAEIAAFSAELSLSEIVSVYHGYYVKYWGWNG